MIAGRSLMKKLTCAAALLLATAQNVAAEGLAGSEWKPVEIEGEAPPDGVEMFVQFRGEGKVAGHGGCNRFSGTFNLDGAAITIGPLASTRMACPAPVMQAETAFLAALQSASTCNRQRVHLELSNASGQTVARLIQTDAD
jgi:heat shock protein HslJ